MFKSIITGAFIASFASVGIVSSAAASTSASINQHQMFGVQYASQISFANGVTATKNMSILADRDSDDDRDGDRDHDRDDRQA